MRFLKFLDQVMGKSYLNRNPYAAHCRKDFQSRAGRSGVFLSSVVWKNRDTHTLAPQVRHSGFQQDDRGRPCARVKVKDM